MSADHDPVLSPDVDLDDLLRSLRKSGEQGAPSLGTDEQGSFLANTHLGRASHTEEHQGAGEALASPPISSEAPADQPPTASVVEGGTMPESVAAGTVVATPSAVDPGAGQRVTDAPASDPSGRSEVVANEISIKTDAPTLDYAAATSHDFVVAVTEASGLTHAETVTVAVADENEAPTDIVVAGGAVPENAAGGTVVATLSAMDPDSGESFTYSLAFDASDRFEIVGNEVRIKAGATLDYEAATSHDLIVTVTDSGGLTHTETITIAVTNQNEAPTDITMAGGTVQENAPAGTVVATLGAVDPDAGGTFTYSLAADPSGQFEIVGNEIKVKAGAALDYEAATSHNVVVTVTDAGGLTHTETVTIAVTNQSGSIVGTSGNDVLNGSGEEDSIRGLAGNDRLNGGAGNDTLDGGTGNDTLDGGVGNDTMLGGAGNDTYVVDSAGDVVTELAGEGTDTVQSSVTHTLSANVENLTLTGSGNVNGTGNALANTLTGNAGNNVLDGGDGNDTINAGAGNDTLLGGAGNDTLTGGAGDDAMFGGAGNDTYVVDSAGDVVTELAGEGTDTVQSSVTHTLSANVENLTLTGSGNVNGSGNALANTLTGNTGNNVLDGGDGNDSINAGTGNDTLLGGAGNDTLNGGAGNDTMLGGAGNDTYVVDAAGDTVTELAGEGTDTVQSSVTYTLSANVENLTLTGSGNVNGAGNALGNTLTGNTGNNVLDGGDGNDTLNGGAGNDTMLGGAGNDTYVVDSAADTVTELAGEGTDTVQSSVTHTLSANVENLTLTGSGNVNGAGNALGNTLTGNAGNNVLDGGDGNDSISAGTGNDTLLGGAGNDTLNGGAGDDAMFGGAGNDTYVVNSAGDTVTEIAGEGTDTVQSSVTHTLSANVENLTLTGSANVNGTGNALGNTLTGNTGNNVLDGGDGNDSINAGSGNDTLLGGAGNDTLNGGAGNDAMLGGAGNDTYVVDSAGDTVTELAGEGTDTVQSSVTHTLSANVENLTLTGSGNVNGAGNALGNTLTGNAGNNVLDGGDGNDSISAGTGNDTLLGGAGNDTLNGGTGNDVMLGGEGRDSLIGGAGNDVFIYMQGHGSDTVNGGTGGWIDAIALDQSAGSLQLGADWTLTLTSGTIANQSANELVLSAEADGFVSFADGSRVDFVDVERIQW